MFVKRIATTGKPLIASLARRQIGQKLHKESLKSPEVFWGQAANGIDWIHQTSSILHNDGDYAVWFPSHVMNTCYNCLDRHVATGRADQSALIFDSPVTGTKSKISYGALLSDVQSFAALLIDNGVKKGDRVVLYMPNIPNSAVAMLACSRIGAIHSVVFGGFAAPELATRITDCKPKVIIASSCGIDGAKVIPYKNLLDEAIRLTEQNSGHKVSKCIILQRPQSPGIMTTGRDINWADAVSSFKEKSVPCEPMKATDPLYILYTSGTTGSPKGVVRDNGGHAVALKWSIEHIFGMRPGDVFWAASDIGWVVGHSFSVYGPLLHGCTSIFYEGKPIGTPDATAFFRVLSEHKVNGFFTAPTAIRVIKAVDPDGELPKKFDLSSLRHVFLAGERCDPDTLRWAEEAFRVPVRDNWWQTETGWPICSNMVGIEGYLPVKYGSCYRPVPGYDVQILDADNKPAPRGTLGKIAIKLPLPPGAMLTLYNNHARFQSAYLASIPGYYDTGDAGVIDEDGYVHVMSRTDDVINVAGHRLSTGAMEEVLADHIDVAEAAVVGIRDDMKGQVPLGLVVLNANCKTPKQQLCNEIVSMVRDRIGPVAAFRKVVIVKRLPKTRSGKVLRATLRAIGNNEKYKVPATVEDASVVDEIEAIIRAEEEL